MKEWRVTWSIDVSGDTPREAAEAAEDYMREHGARQFDVVEHARKSMTHIVNLDEEEPS